jgi:hypothetical protein
VLAPPASGSSILHNCSPVAESNAVTVVGPDVSGPRNGSSPDTAEAASIVQALDRAATGGRDGQGRRRGRQQRAEDLREWHALLIERLIGSAHEDLFDRLVTHEALAGPEVTFLQARLAREHGDEEAARRLVKRCLASLPGHRDFQRFAPDIGV